MIVEGSNLIIEKLPKIRTRAVRSWTQFTPRTSPDSPDRGLFGDARGVNWVHDLYLLRQLRQARERRRQAKDCTACRLVKYCGVDCQRAHRKQHKKACKQRAAELKDEQLYSQGRERPEGDFCPICTLPIAFPMCEHSVIEWCCMKRICEGCDMAAEKRGMDDCAFCRTPCPDNDADRLAMIMTRVRKKDPDAIYFLGQECFFGELGLQKDMQKAIELWSEAAELGSIDALFNLGNAYYSGECVEEDVTKAVELYEKAAMHGHIESRDNLGYYEEENGNYDRALKHYLISAKMGFVDSVENIEEMFKAGLATKEQYAEALKGYQDAVEEMKSHDRDEAKRLGY
ncbi:hypothetical protein THAOC_34989 [Thalassiosira oceanica]|uniref:MYND-type domain-containing protein n=1 Tax=Thalassiosira oceanica TaxID=159749 RepID=K0RB87_THAOC|nr:hypothetical protein THAOC_34989 [Thalassiosira oceanica]|eukprot:EJK46346.1 hypothetical protein THAOC_34989 [Thalassiosira oceanica]